ncbi:MAG TPA: NADH-quinone oxidoreductase subunit L [Myxococcota bacterium]|nr:NADH-quinone oxidoreductase subunit L [Myxococcota bacterium]
MFLASQTIDTAHQAAAALGPRVGEAHAAEVLSWVILLPLIGAFINGVFGKKLSRSTVTAIGVGSVLLAFGFAAWEVIRLTGLPSGDYIVVNGWTWFDTGELNLEFAFMLDALSSVMVLIVTGVGTLIHVFSTAYMRDDEGYWKFFAYLNLFMFSMLLLILGKNLVVLFVGWEGVGLCSYLLIGFWYKDMEKAEAGQKAFVANRIGDLAFLIATFMLLFYSHGSLDFVSEGGVAGAVNHLTSSGEGGESTLFVIALLYFVAATGKSAQLPLYVWLPDAMAGPTPVSALIHAATMVTAGVYMMARMNPLFAAAPDAMTIVALVGGFTALFAATIALVQNDIKKVLAYSTVSQIGFMVLAVGVGNYVGAIFHLMTHAFFKACLFLGSGSVIHAMHHEQDIRQMGGLRKKLPITNITFFVSCLAIAGIPFFSGFFSKDEILFNAIASHAIGGSPNYLAGIFGFLAAACTAFYMFRLYYLTFGGTYRGDPEVYDHAHEETAMTFPLAFLAVLAALAGFVGIPHIIHGAHALHAWLDPNFGWLADTRYYYSHSAPLEIGVMVGSSLIGLAGLFIAKRWYDRADLPVAPTQAAWHRVLTNKYYVDEIYDWAFVRPLRATASLLHKVVDVGFIDGVLVRGPAKALGFIGQRLRGLQTGDVQSYVTVIVVGLATALLFAA